MPSSILGAVLDAAMNAAYPLAVYAAVCAHLGEPLDFPGSIESWQMTQIASSAMLNAYLEEWSVLTEKQRIKGSMRVIVAHLRRRNSGLELRVGMVSNGKGQCMSERR